MTDAPQAATQVAMPKFATVDAPVGGIWLDQRLLTGN
jgi:hypothetical protein